MLKSGFTYFQPTLTFEHRGKSYFKFELSHGTRVKERYMNESKLKYNDSVSLGLRGTLADLGNDHETFGEAQNAQTKSCELILKVDNIIPIWRLVIPNMASEFETRMFF